MKILLLSDSHGSMDFLKLMAIYKDYTIIHCGDFCVPTYKIPSKIKYVSGNCDRISNPKELVIEIEGKRIFITHGDKYSVKQSMNLIYYRAKELKADYCFYGHTHIQDVLMYDGVVFINPGSFLYNNSFALVYEDKALLCDIYNKKEINY